MLTETLWNRAMEESGFFNPLEAGVALAPTRAAAGPGASAAWPGPGSPQTGLRGACCVEFLVLLALRGPVFPTRWSAVGAGARLCLACGP